MGVQSKLLYKDNRRMAKNIIKQSDSNSHFQTKLTTNSTNNENFCCHLSSFCTCCLFLLQLWRSWRLRFLRPQGLEWTRVQGNWLHICLALIFRTDWTWAGNLWRSWWWLRRWLRWLQRIKLFCFA